MKECCLVCLEHLPPRWVSKGCNTLLYKTFHTLEELLTPGYFSAAQDRLNKGDVIAVRLMGGTVDDVQPELHTLRVTSSDSASGVWVMHCCAAEH